MGQKNTLLKDVRVLVLDDEAAIRRLISTALTENGAAVNTASDGREGLQVLLQESFDVLVVDLKMREMDGIAFLQEALKIWPWLGVVIITGYADESAVSQANALGVRRILTKPLQLEALRQNVMEEANSKRERVERPETPSLERVQYQLGILRKLSETAIESQSLVEALRSLSSGLASVLPSAVIGVLGLESEEEVLLLNVREPISPRFLAKVEEEMRRRYEALSTDEFPAQSLHVETDGIPCDEAGKDNVGSTTSVPIMSGGELHGLLTLATASDNAYTSTDISFLYHAANHLSTVLTALSRMRQLAIHDPLTGLYNRRHMEEELERAWLLSERYGHSLCVVIIDIDYFKTLNDTFGHLAGDRALREFSALLRKVARASDILARYGGDEMVVVLPQAGLEEAHSFCDRLTLAVQEQRFCDQENPICLTISVGVTNNQNSGNPSSTDHLLNQADEALYASKKAGRDQVSYWPDLQDQPEGAAEKAKPKASHAEPNRLAPSAERTPPPSEDQAVPGESALRIAGSAGEPSSSVPPLPREDPNRKGRVLVVDDDPFVGTVVTEMLKDDDYDVCTEASADGAISRLAQEQGAFDIVLTDLEMPGKSGLDLLKELNDVDHSIIKIVVTGHATADNAISCLRHGAYDFIEKPILHDQLLAVVRRADEYRRLLKENKRYQDYLEEMVSEKSAALREALQDVQHSYNFTLEALVAMLDARERATGQHSVRVRDLALILARHLNIDGVQLDNIGRGALLHDIGKIGTPDAILLKPGPLTDPEWEIMKNHAQIGFNVLQSSPVLQDAAEIVLSHQEHYDGSGYPRGLKGEEICLGARIFAIVDAYDAMRSERVYQTALSPDEALKEITDSSGTKFDPAMVAAFLECQPQIELSGDWIHCPASKKDDVEELRSATG